MTCRPIWCTAVVAVALTACSGLDQHSYEGGRQYVEMRQPSANWSDPQALAACSIYSDGFAQLDGYNDREAFMQGCADAAAETSFQPVVGDLHPTPEDIDAMIQRYLAETEAHP